MAAMFKQEINKKGTEQSEFPSVCESCLGPNPYIRMLKQDAGAECKICSRPFTVFRWTLQGQSKYQRTALCTSCCRVRNCCSLCMLDLQFGLPIQVRDAALKLVKQGPSTAINREYHAQNQKALLSEENAGEVPREYGKAESAARDLLKKLARSEPYARKQTGSTTSTAASEGKGKGKGAGSSAEVQRKAAASRPTISDLMPPADQSITSLFLLGVEEDLPEYAIRQHFSKYGAIKSLVCSHRARCAFVNFTTRKAAETAALDCAGDVLIKGCPLRVQWGKPRQLGGHGTEKANAALANAAVRQAREAEKEATAAAQRQQALEEQEAIVAPALPPGQERAVYRSMQDEED